MVELLVMPTRNARTISQTGRVTRDGIEIMKNNQGFTLIELLVVISVMTLFSSMIIANVNSARGKAKVTAALSSLDNSFLAAVLCLTDNKPLTGAGAGSEECGAGGSFFQAPTGQPVCDGSTNKWPDIGRYGFSFQICMSDVIQNQFVLLTTNVTQDIICAYNFSNPAVVNNTGRCEVKLHATTGVCTDHGSGGSSSGSLCALGGSQGCTVGVLCPQCSPGEYCDPIGE